MTRPRVVALLVHADGAVASGCRRRGRRPGAGLHGSRELVARHLEVAVAGDADDGAVRVADLGGDGGGQAVAHGARGRGELGAAAAAAIVAVQPGGEVAGAVGDDRRRRGRRSAGGGRRRPCGGRPAAAACCEPRLASRRGRRRCEAPGGRGRRGGRKRRRRRGSGWACTGSAGGRDLVGRPRSGRGRGSIVRAVPGGGSAVPFVTMSPKRRPTARMTSDSASRRRTRRGDGEPPSPAKLGLAPSGSPGGGSAADDRQRLALGEGRQGGRGRPAPQPGPPTSTSGTRAPSRRRATRRGPRARARALPDGGRAGRRGVRRGGQHVLRQRDHHRAGAARLRTWRRRGRRSSGMRPGSSTSPPTWRAGRRRRR